jgi:ribonuclease P protein component
MSFTLGKSERIKSRKLIEKMFVEGDVVKQYPFRAVYIKTAEKTGVQMAVSVPKKRLKKAVDRNKVKRLIRESFRLQRDAVLGEVKGSYALMIIYLANEIPDMELVHQKIKKLLVRFVNDIESNNDEKVD